MAEAEPEGESQRPATINNYYVQGGKDINISGSVIQQINVKDTSGEAFHGGNTVNAVTKLSTEIFCYHDEPLHSGKEVYLGYQKHVTGENRKLAIKFLSFTERHKKEINILLKLDHPHIVKVIASAKCSGVPPKMYIAMELCCQNLNQYIEGNSYNLSKAVSFIRQMVLAIVYIHSKEILHRDLKPSNILISIDGNSIKVSDFGISREMDGDRSQITISNPNAGTEGFKSPETYIPSSKKHKKTKLGYKSDIFPLGICVYYIITHGKHPFGQNSHDWIYNIVHKKPNISEIPDFPSHKKNQLNKLLLRMLQYQPGNRPSAAQVQRTTFFKDMDQITKPLEGPPSARPGSKGSSDSKIQDSQRQGKKANTKMCKRMAKEYKENLKQQQGRPTISKPGVDTSKKAKTMNPTVTKQKDNLPDVTTALRRGADRLRKRKTNTTVTKSYEDKQYSRSADSDAAVPLVIKFVICFTFTVIILLCMFAFFIME